MFSSPLLQNLGGYIDGAWTGGTSGKTFEVINPATGELLAMLPAMGAAETRDAIAAAKAVLTTGATVESRRGVLRAIVEALESAREELGRILTHEQGKPWKEAQTEVDYAAGFFRYYADNIALLAPTVLKDHPRGCTWRIHRRPAGVVALITPWNFPIAMLAKKLAAAIAADCPCVIKPSSRTPLTVVALFHLLEREVKLSKGKANLVMGPAGPISDALCSHPEVKVISFTGSTEVGKDLITRSASQVKRLTLELGGNAPFLVFNDADLDAAADHLVANKFRSAGQTCVCANRILVQRPVVDAFAARVAVRVRQMKVGNGMEPETDMGPLIDKEGFMKVRAQMAEALAAGARLVAGELPAAPERPWGCFFPPAVLTAVTPDMRCCNEETFGPLVPIVAFDTDEDGVRLANATEYGLAAYVFTNGHERAQWAIEQLHFGHVGHNTGSGPTPEAPFGGMKASGFGREGGIEGLHEFTELQTVAQAD